MNFFTRSRNIEIRVDRRTELLGIIQIISHYRDVYPNLLEKRGNKQYIEEIEQTFGMYKNHPVIQRFNKLIENDHFGYDAPVSLFLQLNDDFTFTELDDYPFVDRLNQDPNVIKMLNLLPEFAHEIEFDAFYKKNGKRYNQFLDSIKQELDKQNPTKFLNDYYGLQNNNRFVVNLIPFQTFGNYGTHHQNIIYSNICELASSTTENEMYVYDEYNPRFVYLIFHEFSHSFINPLTEKYHLISKEDPIFSNITEIMKDQAYGRNDTIINEHIIRALTLRYIFYSNDIKRYDFVLNREKENGFIYIENILDALVFYENHRNMYSNIEQYYPFLIQAIVTSHKTRYTKK